MRAVELILAVLLVFNIVLMTAAFAYTRRRRRSRPEELTHDEFQERLRRESAELDRQLEELLRKRG